MNHEYSLIKILLDNPGEAAEILAQVDAAKVENESAKLILDSAARLIEKKAKLNRNAILHFTDLDEDEKEYLEEDMALIDSSGGSLENLPLHVKEILHEWSARALRLLLNDTVKILNSTGDVEKSISSFSEGTKAIMNGKNTEHKSLAEWVDIHEEYLKRLDDSADNLFGLPSLNKIRGASPGTGELIGVGAGPKVGKSSLYNTIVRNFYHEKEPLLLLSGEMAGRKSYERFLAAEIGASTGLVSTKSLLDDRVLSKEYKSLSKRLKQATDVFVDYEVLSIAAIRKYVYYYYHKYGVKDFLIDRLGLFSEVRDDEFKGRRQVTGALRMLVNELPEPIRIVLATQLINARAKDGARPKASDVFGGTGMQADFTQLYLLWRPSKYDRSVKTFPTGPWTGWVTQVPNSAFEFVEVFIGLNTNGPEDGTALLVLDTEKQVFEDYGESKNEYYVKNHKYEIERIQSGENRFDPALVPDPEESIDEESSEDEDDIFGSKKARSNGEKDLF